MDSSDAMQLLISAILISLSAFFSSSKIALTTVNRIRTRNLTEAEDARAVILTKVIEDQGKMLGIILIGNNIVNLYASSLATTLAISMRGSKMIGVVTDILTLVILVFDGITPKTLTTPSTETLPLHCVKIIYGVMAVLTLVIFTVNQLSMGMLSLLRVDSNKKREAITKDELRTIMEVSHGEGVIESEGRKMINNVLDFGGLLAKDVMVPRIDMTLVNVDTFYQELTDISREEKYIRIPVYEDTTDSVIGIINMKGLLLLDDREDFNIRSFLRQPLYTYEFRKTPKLMIEMRQTFNSIVTVLDEYSSTAGLITLEDIPEGIVGEVHDEHNEEEEESLAEVGPGKHLVEGSIELDDLNDWLGLLLKSEDYDPIGGLVVGLLDHLPGEGEEVTREGICPVVKRVDKNRIRSIRVFLPQSEAKEAETEEAQKK